MDVRAATEAPMTRDRQRFAPHGAIPIPESQLRMLCTVRLSAFPNASQATTYSRVSGSRSSEGLALSKGFSQFCGVILFNCVPRSSAFCLTHHMWYVIYHLYERIRRVPAKFRSIEKPVQLTGLVYDAIRDSILSGHLKPGDIVNEIPLAKELGTSRTPVREALLALSSQGLVEILPRKGIRITYFTERDVHEVCEIRELIELGVLEKVARRGSTLSLSRLQVALDKQRDAFRTNDVPEFLRADRLFHVELISLLANRRLARILENLRDLIDVMGQQALTLEGRVEEVLAEHQAVVTCIQKGQVSEAKEALRVHLAKTKHAVLERVRSDSDGTEG